MATVTPAEMLDQAHTLLNDADAALSDAAECLVWPPGTVLTDEEAADRAQMLAGIRRAKTAINEAKR